MDHSVAYDGHAVKALGDCLADRGNYQDHK